MPSARLRVRSRFPGKVGDEDIAAGPGNLHFRRGRKIDEIATSQKFAAAIDIPAKETVSQFAKGVIPDSPA